jgi:hypothetical protein
MMTLGFCIGFFCTVLAQPAEGTSQRAVLYRLLAQQAAQEMMLVADSAPLPEALRHELKNMLQSYITEIAEWAESPEIETMSREEIATAAKTAYALFESETLAPWQANHVQVADAIRGELQIAEALLRNLGDPDALVSAARTAGLPAEKEADFRAEIAAAQKSFQSIGMMRQFFQDNANQEGDRGLASAAMEAELPVGMAKAKFRTLQNLRAMLPGASRDAFNKALRETAEE